MHITRKKNSNTRFIFFFLFKIKYKVIKKRKIQNIVSALEATTRKHRSSIVTPFKHLPFATPLKIQPFNLIRMLRGSAKLPPLLSIISLFILIIQSGLDKLVLHLIQTYRSVQSRATRVCEYKSILHQRCRSQWMWNRMRWFIYLKIKNKKKNKKTQRRWSKKKRDDMCDV